MRIPTILKMVLQKNNSRCRIQKYMYVMIRFQETMKGDQAVRQFRHAPSTSFWARLTSHVVRKYLYWKKVLGTTLPTLRHPTSTYILFWPDFIWQVCTKHESNFEKLNSCGFAAQLFSYTFQFLSSRRNLLGLACDLGSCETTGWPWRKSPPWAINFLFNWHGVRNIRVLDDTVHSNSSLTYPTMLWFYLPVLAF